MYMMSRSYSRQLRLGCLLVFFVFIGLGFKVFELWEVRIDLRLLEPEDAPEVDVVSHDDAGVNGCERISDLEAVGLDCFDVGLPAEHLEQHGDTDVLLACPGGFVGHFCEFWQDVRVGLVIDVVAFPQAFLAFLGLPGRLEVKFVLCHRWMDVLVVLLLSTLSGRPCLSVRGSQVRRCLPTVRDSRTLKV